MMVNLFSYAQFDFIHSNVLGPSPVSTMKTHSILLFLWMTLILVIHEFILWIINMKFMIFIKFLLNWLITHFSNSVKIFHSIIAMKYIEIDLLISSMFIGPCLITLVLIWDAWTRRPGQRTRVRRGGTRGRGRDVTDRASVPRRTASCHVASPESGRRGWNRRRFGGNRRWRGQNRADSVRIGRNGQVRPKFKKKKKKERCKRTVLLT